MPTYRARRVPDDHRSEPEVLIDEFEEDNEAAALRRGNAAVRKTHVLRRHSDYRLERFENGEWKLAGLLDTSSPGLDGVPHEWSD